MGEGIQRRGSVQGLEGETQCVLLRHVTFPFFSLSLSHLKSKRTSGYEAVVKKIFGSTEMLVMHCLIDANCFHYQTADFCKRKSFSNQQHK